MASPEKQARRTFWELAKLSSIGWEMGVAVAIGWGVGYWLDSRLGTKPWLMLLFLLLGVAAGFRGMIRQARAAMHKDENQERVPSPPENGHK